MSEVCGTDVEDQDKRIPPWRNPGTPLIGNMHFTNLFSITVPEITERPGLATY
jgi:hypothetical protein